MEMLSPNAKILLTLTKPRKYREILHETGLSGATVSKWLKIYTLTRVIRKEKDGRYVLTEEGRKFLLEGIRKLKPILEEAEKHILELSHEEL